VALRGLFIISPEGVLRQKTVNDLPVGRSGAAAGPARKRPLRDARLPFPNIV
jgi:hypothetical protein